jgi:hypothetical protein
MRWLSAEEAAMILDVTSNTLRNNESMDGLWCTVWGQRLRIYREGIRRARRYSETEVRRLAATIRKDSIRP